MACTPRAYNVLMIRTLSLSLVFCLSSVFAQIEKGAPADPASLAELAAAADLVVLAQVKDTDYFRRRDIPVSGSAYLKVLISYKGAAPVDIIEIYEKGLHDKECYFPNPTVFEEGRRFLLFLVRDPEDTTRFRGLPQGCALDVLVNDKNRYALRYPVTGIVLSDSLDPLAIEMKFSDSYALANDADLLPGERDSMRNAGEIVAQASGQWLYTRGVPLSHLRGLMGKENLSD